MTESDSPRPFLSVVAGSPTPEELAAVIAVITARRAAAAVEAPVWSLWARKSRMVRSPQSYGSGAWRASMMPR